MSLLTLMRQVWRSWRPVSPILYVLVLVFLSFLRMSENPFRESGPPANMAKLILLRHKVLRFLPHV